MSPPSNHSSRYIIFFMLSLCFVCAFILSSLATVLKDPQLKAEKIFRSKQMLIASKLISDYKKTPTEKILSIYNEQIEPFLINESGNTSTFEKQRFDKDQFISNYEKNRENLKWKLAYRILSEDKSKPRGYVFPISGHGLWDKIHGYIAIATDGNHVIGTSWYDQKETPGLGANISETKWQKQFYDKVIFQPKEDGSTDFKKTKLGIVVVKGKVANVLGDSPKADNAVDGISGASMTCKGVMQAYQDSLAPYRNFLTRLAK